jgi:hypothetical protein
MQEEHEFEAGLGFMANSKPSETMVIVSKKRKKKKRPGA